VFWAAFCLLEKTNIYNISSSPAVFKINSTINHTLSFSRADFHRAKPFQNIDQINSKEMPKVSMGVNEMFVI